MNDIDRRRMNTFLGVRQFGAEHAASFPPTSFGGQLFAVLNSVIDALETHTSTQTFGRGQVRESTLTKVAARDELIRDLEAMRRTARSMALTMPGLGDKFRVPHGQSDQALLATARAAALDALPLKAEFIERRMPSDFLEDLKADIEAMEEAITGQKQGEESHVAATAAIDHEIERGMTAVRGLDAVVRNTFANDPAVLAAWTTASHVDRPPRRKAAVGPETGAPTTQAS